MGWASGTDMAEVFEKILLKYVPKNKLKQEAKKVLMALEDQDWDCVEEVELFEYLLILGRKEDADYDYDDLEKEDHEKKIKKYKKKFGF